MKLLSTSDIAQASSDCIPEMLQDAFRKFNDASEKLQAKYDLLQQEAESLKAELRQKDKEIKRAEKLSTLGETAAAIAHEIRNPLGAMSLFTSMLKQDLKDRPASLELVQEIEKSIKNLNHIVSNILHFSKTHKADLTPVNVHSLLQEQVHQLLQGLKQVKLSMELKGNPFVYANGYGLRQVFHNVILNALQAIRNDGKIAISTEDGADNEFIITIKDSGPGIAEESLSSIFDPFVTTKDEGTGLGLAIVKQIINQHGGEVAVRNEQGAVFVIKLIRSANNNRNKDENTNC